MTKDELKKEATEYALEWGDKTDGTYACCRDGYLAGAEPREKRIAELEKENTELKEELERNCTPEEICMKLEERIHTLEVYLEGAINFLILNGDVDNPIIQSVENILHITFNKNR